MTITHKTLKDLRALQRAEHHVQWLRANLGKHQITQRVERELLVRRTRIAIDAGSTVQAVLHSLRAIKDS